MQLRSRSIAAAGRHGSACNVTRARPHWLALQSVHHASTRGGTVASSSGSETEVLTVPAEPVKETPAETVFYEGDGGSPAELALSLALTATLIFAPLTIASVGRRLWIKYKFTNKRVIIQNTSPLFKSEVQIAYSEIKEVRTAPRGLGSWGDMVIFTKSGGRIELLGMEKYKELKDYIERCMYTL